jgi:hypothetical protein
MLKMVMDNAVLRIPFLLGCAVAAVIGIAGGYVTIYKVVTFIGN